MKKVVITGSVKLQAEINNWTNFFKNNNYEVLDYPREIEEYPPNNNLSMVSPFFSLAIAPYCQ